MIKHKTPVWRDPSTVLLFVSNIATIVVAIWQQWDIATILLVYWGQAVSIGFFNILRIRLLNSPAFSGMSVNGVSADTIPGVQNFLVKFFIGHYGAFMIMYLVFILVFFDANLLAAVPGIILFFTNHAFSYQYNSQRDLKHLKSGTRLIFFPYLRIIPMHIIIAGAAIFSKAGAFSVIVFLSLKTIADLAMHIIEHKFGKKKIPLSTV